MKTDVSLEDLLFGVTSAPIEAVLGTNGNIRHVLIPGKKALVNQDAGRFITEWPDRNPCLLALDARIPNRETEAHDLINGATDVLRRFNRIGFQRAAGVGRAPP